MKTDASEQCVVNTMKYIVRSGLPLVFVIYFVLYVVGFRPERNDLAKLYVLLMAGFAGIIVTALTLIWLFAWFGTWAGFLPIIVNMTMAVTGYKMVD